MAQRVEIKTITVAAGVPSSAPTSTALSFREGYLERVELRIPPGPSGLVGIALARSGRKVIPKDESEWLITDDEPVTWPVEGFGTGAKWTVLAYNSDIYSHVFQVRMLFRELGTTPPSQQSTVDIIVPNESSDVDQVPDLTDYADVGAST